jgi:nucleoid DNA-binding protein
MKLPHSRRINTKSALTRGDLIEGLSGLLDLPLTHSKEIVDRVFQIIFETLAAGQEVHLMGLGSFAVVKRKPRRNQFMPGAFIPECLAVKFVPSVALKNAVRQAGERILEEEEVP